MQKYPGEQGFRWFVGKVEDVQDPDMLGRARVRVFSLHDDTVAASELPWATPIMPPFSSGSKQFGFSPTGLMIGSIVFGFFMDSVTNTIPMILGTIAGIPDNLMLNHDVPAEARGQSMNTSVPLGPEPGTAFSAKYPYNFVYKSRAGHLLEIDDTPSAERVKLYHAQGSYIEMRPDGSVTVKAAKDKVDVTAGKQTIYTKGECTIQAQKTNITNGTDNIHEILANILTVLKNLANGDNWVGNFGEPLLYKKQLEDQIKILQARMKTDNVFTDNSGLLGKLI